MRGLGVGLGHDSDTSLQGPVKSDQDLLRGSIICYLHQKQLINIAISPEKEGTSGTSLLTLWTPISLRTRSVQVGLFNISRSRCIGLSRLVPRMTDR